jgi:hypothetical protein
MLTTDESVKRIGISECGWSKVIYNNQEAYISSNYLTTEKTEYIDLNNYTFTYSFGGFPEREVQVLKELIFTLENSLDTDEKYIDAWFDNPNNVMDYDSYCRMSSFIAIYFSDWYKLQNVLDFCRYITDEKLLLSVKTDDFRTFFKERQEYMMKIESILETFTEGSEKQKLQQIADYLKDNITYLLDTPNGTTAILTGYGNCNAYAMAFQTMANRLGITCDICVGFSNSGSHAWNRVVLSTGEVLFYDVCYYDSCKNSKYINRTTSPWEVYTLNNYFYNQWHD